MTTPVVLLHGLIGHLQPWAQALTAAGRPCLAPELRGYGSQADVPPGTVTLPTQVDDLALWVKAQWGDAPFDVVGHSVGGVLAMLLALRLPHQVRRVVSVEGNFSLQDAFWSARLGTMPLHEVSATLDSLRADPVAWLARSGVVANPESLALAQDWLAFQPASTLQAMGQSIVAVTGQAAYLDGVRTVFAQQTVSLVAGERSRPAWDVPAWAHEAAAAEVVLPGCGHLMMLEAPQAFVDTLIALLPVDLRNGF